VTAVTGPGVADLGPPPSDTNQDWAVLVRETCPCDFNGTGPALPDGADFTAFLSAFFAGDPAADFDGSGPMMPDGADFNAFLTCFFSPPANCG